MQPNFSLSRPNRLIKATRSALTFCFIVSLFPILAAAQGDPEESAKEKCADALKWKMKQEMGGRYPDVMLDYREARVRQVSNAETGVQGTGRYIRDNNDRGRSFSCDCVVNIRNGSVPQANYKWTDGPSDSSWDQGYDRPIGGGGSYGRRRFY